MGAKNRTVSKGNSKRGGGGGGGGARRAGKRAGGRGRGKNAGAGRGKKVRHELRADEKEARRRSGGVRKKHGGEDELERTRERMRAKLAERKVKNLPAGTSPEERYRMLQDVGQMNYECGRMRLAISNFKEVLLNLPEDPFWARAKLLCLYMNKARSKDARDLLTSKLFLHFLADEDLNAEKGIDSSKADSDVSVTMPAAHFAAVCGCYSVALLTYISVQVLDEAKPGDEFHAEQRLVNRLRRAHKLNPFCAEFIAFYPAFQLQFDGGIMLPMEESWWPHEVLLVREALEYCCCHGQVKVWVDHEGVRRYLQSVLFEEVPVEEGVEEKPPFMPLPPAQTADPTMLVKWRKARQDAMQLWAKEMSVDGGSEEGEEESEEGDNSEEAAESEANPEPPAAKKKKKQ